MTNLSWKEFENYLSQRGFELAHVHDLWEYDFPQDISPKKTDEFQLWCKKDEGLVICAESYEGRINDARLHFELRLPVPYDQLNSTQYKVYSALVHGRNGGGPIGESRTHLLVAPQYDLLKSWSLDLVCGNVRMAKGFSFNVPWEGRLKDHTLNLCERLLNDSEGQFGDFYRAHQFLKLVELRLVSTLPDDVKKMIGYGR
ncbi:MAG: hypothetical protein WCV90_06500 [Candidatus Woesearchaeota archaeon]